VGCDIDDDIIELHAMGRLKDAALREHLDTCESCRARVEEYRAWIALLKKALQEYHRRRDFVCDILSRQLPDKIDFKIPDGGLAIWAKFHSSIPLPPLAEKLKEKGIILSNGLIHNTSSLSLNATRIGFGWMTEKESAKALDILISTVRSMK